MKFSWKAFLLAPLFISFVFTLLTTLGTPPLHAILSFLFSFILTNLFAYFLMGLLGVPCLMIASKFIRPTATLALIVGTLLGAIIFFPISWFEFVSSGPDSGPPVGTFTDSLWRSRYDFTNWIFPIAGGITSLLYWWLATRLVRNAGPTPPG